MLLGPFRFKTFFFGQLSQPLHESRSHFGRLAVNFIDTLTDFLKVKFIVSECVCVCAFVQHHFRPILILINILHMLKTSFSM